MQNYAINESNYISSMQGIATIKNNNKQLTFSKANDLIFGVFQDKIFNLGKINITLSWQSGIASVLFLIIILIYTSIQVLNKDIKLGELMAVLGISGGLLPSIANLALISIPINEAKIAFNRMHEFASIEKEKNEGSIISSLDSIIIDSLSFRFVGRKELLKNITLSLTKGTISAIVGESGSGKSTLGQILQRFYNLENGSILINNEFQLNDIELDSYRNLIGVIPQDITIFNGNVIDNILLGEHVDIENIGAFLKQYGFDVYFSRLPQGVATILGEEGINLSGGQKQIIAFARVLYKKPQFLILDEVTSAMDRNTEKFSMQILQKIKNDCIILFISHRLHTLKQFADTIYVLRDGIISNSGNHEELMQSDNFYSDYWKV